MIHTLWSASASPSGLSGGGPTGQDTGRTLLEADACASEAHKPSGQTPVGLLVNLVDHYEETMASQTSISVLESPRGIIIESCISVRS